LKAKVKTLGRGGVLTPATKRDEREKVLKRDRMGTGGLEGRNAHADYRKVNRRKGEKARGGEKRKPEKKVGPGKKKKKKNI